MSCVTRLSDEYLGRMTVRTDADLAPRVVVRGAQRWNVRRNALERAVRAALAKAAPQVRGEVTVVLTSDREIRRLNREYRRLDQPTDVLSFEVGDGLSQEEPFGDVVVSVETARRQAKAYDAKLESELLRLAVHGTLHLCGLDHRERGEAARMHGLTRRILKELR